MDYEPYCQMMNIDVRLVKPYLESYQGTLSIEATVDELIRLKAACDGLPIAASETVVASLCAKGQRQDVIPTLESVKAQSVPEPVVAPVAPSKPPPAPAPAQPVPTPARVPAPVSASVQPPEPHHAAPPVSTPIVQERPPPPAQPTATPDHQKAADASRDEEDKKGKKGGLFGWLFASGKEKGKKSSDVAGPTPEEEVRGHRHHHHHLQNLGSGGDSTSTLRGELPVKTRHSTSAGGDASGGTSNLILKRSAEETNSGYPSVSTSAGGEPGSTPAHQLPMKQTAEGFEIDYNAMYASQDWRLQPRQRKHQPVIGTETYNFESISERNAATGTHRPQTFPKPDFASSTDDNVSSNVDFDNVFRHFVR